MYHEIPMTQVCGHCLLIDPEHNVFKYHFEGCIFYCDLEWPHLTFTRCYSCYEFASKGKCSLWWDFGFFIIGGLTIEYCMKKTGVKHVAVNKEFYICTLHRLAASGYQQDTLNASTMLHLNGMIQYQRL